MRCDYQILLESPPLKLLAGSAPDSGENTFNELPMQNECKLTLLLVSCYHQ